MSGYTKLFSSILASTVWREDKDTRIVWITLLAMADRNGVAEASVPGLADFARLSIDETQKALTILSSPDPYSRTKEYEGRRITEVPGGWLLLNHEKYRTKMSEDERREYKRIKQQQYRTVGKSIGVDTPVDTVDSVDETLTVLPNVTQATPSPSPSPDPVPDRFARFWDAYPKKRDKGHAEKAFKALKVSEAMLDLMLAAIAAQRQSLDWKKERGQFIPLPATWLHGKRWDDEVDAAPASSGPDYSAHWYDGCKHEPRCKTLPEHQLKAYRES